MPVCYSQADTKHEMFSAHLTFDFNNFFPKDFKQTYSGDFISKTVASLNIRQI